MSQGEIIPWLNIGCKYPKLKIGILRKKQINIRNGNSHLKYQNK